jgi:hypothetical protein
LIGRLSFLLEALAIFKRFFHEWNGNGFKRPEDRSRKTEEIAYLRLSPRNEKFLKKGSSITKPNFQG